MKAKKNYLEKHAVFMDWKTKQSKDVDSQTLSTGLT